MPSRRTLLLAGEGGQTAGRQARAQPAMDSLRITWRDAVPDLDPYRNQLRAGITLAHHIWDCLVDRDPDTLELRPLLATDWTGPDETGLTVTLREGVRFHDGSLFGPEDVVATATGVAGGAGTAVPGLYAWLAGAEALDARRVRLRFNQPFPAALDFLAMVLPILPRARWAAGADPAAPPIGTGPYRVADRQGGRAIALERFEGYFPGGPKSRPSIARIAIRAVDDEQTPFTELLGGQADWIWQLAPDQFEALQHQPGLAAERGESMRLGYLSIDAAGRSGCVPLTLLKVRQAVLHALDRPALARRLAGVATRVLDAPCFPSQFGCDAAAAVRYPFDPARARALLAEAGYPDGFAADLVSSVLPEEGQAVRSDLQAVGISATLVQLPTGAALERIAAGQAPLFLGSWGSYSINDVAAFLPQFFGGGPLDQARVPEIEALLDEAGRSGDTDKRRGLYSQAIRLITAQALWLPTHAYATTYGFSRALVFHPSPDEVPRFYRARWR